MDILIATHLICAGAYASILVFSIARRAAGPIGIYFSVACLATVAWALVNLWPGFQPFGIRLIVESVRSVAWLCFIGAFLVPPGESMLAHWRRGGTIAAIPLIGVLLIGNDVAHFAIWPDYQALDQLQVIMRIAAAVLALSLVENLYRNVTGDRRWNVIPVCIAIGIIFAYELFLYSDVLLFRHRDPSLLAARAIVDALAAPLLALAMARSANWRSDIRVSHNVVFHVATLLASGAFLLAVAAVGMLFRRYGGDWALVLQMTTLFGSVIVLATVLSSESARSRIRGFVLRNFFSYRYDYRVEWIRFIESLSSSDAHAELPERVIRAIAHIVNSPGGVLFQRQGDFFGPTAYWNAHVPQGARESVGSDFVASFRGGSWIQELPRLDDVATGDEPNNWRQAGDGFWLAVPLTHSEAVIGFVLVTEPRAPLDLDWEVYDLLRTAARQAGSYLAEDSAARALADAQILHDYSKRFAFVVHDIKNLSSQLGLIVSNARRHGSDPEFQADVMRTIENSVSRMNKLLSQLRAQTHPDKPDAVADALAVVRDVVSSHGAAARIDMRCGNDDTMVKIESEGLRSALTHLINNAIEASDGRGGVVITVAAEGDELILEIADQGPGMETNFVRDELFRPFRSTKSDGYGIGAFQTRELVMNSGGQLQVESRPGQGTTMRIVLARASAAAV